MKISPLIRQTFSVVCFICALQLVAVASAKAVYLWQGRSPLLRTDLADTPDYIGYRDFDFAKREHQIVLIGGSNSHRGFLPTELAPSFPGIGIYSFPVSAPNMTELKQVIESVFSQIPTEKRATTMMVLSIWVGCFVEDATRWPTGRTEFDSDRLESHLYRRTQAGNIEPIVSDAAMPYVSALMLPRRLLMHYYRTVLQAVTPDRPPTREELMKTWNNFFGNKPTLVDEQFDKLTEVAQFVSDQGGHLLIVDMPIARWLEGLAPQFGYYQEHKLSYLNKIQQIPNVSYVSLQDMDAEADFVDTVHPQPSITHVWAERLVSPLKKAAPF